MEDIFAIAFLIFMVFYFLNVSKILIDTRVGDKK